MEPAQIGRFELHAQLGQGGMGTVYKAYDPRMDRWVAIKTIAVKDSQQRARFQREIRAAGRLNHPHIVTFYDVDEEGDFAYIVMELVEGETLASRLSTPVAWREAVELLQPICQALAYAHSKGVIHRDVKPANILVSTAGVVKLTDFGVARLESMQQRITTTESTVGTLFYIAPEQARNEVVDGRADLFSLGIVLFELISSHHPFSGAGPAQILHRITGPDAADLDLLTSFAPPALIRIIEQALSKDPAARFSNASEFAAALSACLHHPFSSDYTPPFVLSKSRGAEVGPSQPRLDLVSELSLSSEEEVLLLQAFTGHDALHIEREFRKGFSGARVLLATPVRSGGKRLAKVVLKLDTPAAIEREWQAYKDHVKDRLPPMTAHIPEAPLHAESGQLALLRYTFAGSRSDISPESLRSYYGQHTAAEVARLLEHGVFEVFRNRWWDQRQTNYFSLRQEFDRLLPVHLVVEFQESAPQTPLGLIAGKVSFETCRTLEVGQFVEIKNFMADSLQPGKGEITLHAAAPAGNPNVPVRIRLYGLNMEDFSLAAGDSVPPITGLVQETRHHILQELAQPAFLGQNLNQRQLAVGRYRCANPLYDYESLLGQHISAMSSIIHGDLNMENILVTPASDLAWLIDFATTRDNGYTLYDFMRLETQVITKLIPETGATGEEILGLMDALHLMKPSLDRQLSRKLAKPYQVLLAIRRAAQNYLNNRSNWDEYYLGLVLVLIGALKFKELDPAARRSALVAAGVARGLIQEPSLRLTDMPPVPVQSPARGRKQLIGLGLAGLVALAAVGFGFWLARREPLPDPVGPRTNVALISPQAVEPLIETPAVTVTLLPAGEATALNPLEGVAVVPLDIYEGPGPEYPIFDQLPVGNAVRVTGRSQDSDWWQIAHPGGQGGYGWVIAGFVEIAEPQVLAVASALPPPTATPTPAPTPTPACPTPDFFYTVSNQYPTLGCSTMAGRSDFRSQTFEQGLMIWRREPSPAEIYILYQDGSWRSLSDPAGPTQPSCEQAQQTGQLGPIRSFGLIWCTEELERLGLPLTAEIAFEDSPVEEFEHGLVFRLGQAAFALFNDENEWIPTAPLTTETLAYQLYFAANVDGEYRIYTVPPGSDQPVQLTNGPGDEGRPALSPDGQRLAFGSTRNGKLDIFVLDLNTQVVTQLTADPGHDHTPAWSPDGRRIAFQSKRAGNYDIYIMNADGSNQTPLTTDPADEYWPTWSPDGTRILFESRRDEEQYSQLYLMQADGGNQIRLLKSKGNDGMPAWAKTGQIAFTSDRDGNRELYLMDNLEARPKRLTRNSTNDWFPAWSPDGRYLAYTAGEVKAGEIYWLDTTDMSTTKPAQAGVDNSDLIITFAIEPQPETALIAEELDATGIASFQPAAILPTCASSPAPEMLGLWERYGDKLGCPTGSVVVISKLAEQLFEGGHMFWRADTDDVYLVLDRRRDGTELFAGTWQSPAWKWDGADPGGIGMSPPAGRFEPVRGFGWLWRTQLNGPSGSLGWALDKEYGFDNTGRVQRFEQGLAFKGSDTKLYALLTDGRFFAYDPKLGEPPVEASVRSDTGFRPASVFEAAWSELGQGAGPLGYPLGAAIDTGNYARQTFDRGFMFWWESLEDTQPIWVIYSPDPLANQGERWQQYPNQWHEGQPEYPPDCPESQAPFGPKFGFGLTWCHQAGVKAQLGQPRDGEFGSGDAFPKGAVQFFQGGLMFESPADQQIWALLDGAGWYRFNY